METYSWSFISAAVLSHLLLSLLDSNKAQNTSCKKVGQKQATSQLAIIDPFSLKVKVQKIPNFPEGSSLDSLSMICLKIPH